MKYFAYGSNMDPDRMLERGVKFKSRERAVLKDRELVFNKVASSNDKRGYANIRYKKGSIVEGVLYEIEDSDIAELDRYEGYPEHYIREEVIVYVGRNCEPVKAITYIASTSKVKDGLKPSKNYLKHLLKAKDVLSEEYYRKLKAQETRD